MTALMSAAEEGHLEICRLLIDRGCKIDITRNNGYTALHCAAEWGHLQTTQYLVEQGGASSLVTTRRGKTPYDLVVAERKGQYKEVMEYLQTVMSEKSPGVTAGQGIEDEVPTEIKLMTDKRSVELYLKLLESGSEKKRDIRLVVVGKKGAGKTSLIKRLFGEDNTDVTSTNGIEIHKIKCKAMSDDGIWNKLDGNYEETEIHARLLKEYEEKLQERGTKEEPLESHIAIKDNTPATSFDESKKSGTVYRQPKKKTPLVTNEYQVGPPVTSQQQHQSLEQAKKDIETMLKSNVDLHDKEEYATLFLWDFAGDEEFYHTHQTFLSPDAIYLVVTKLNEAGDKQAQDLFQLWMDSIHCYSRLEEDRNKSDVNKRTSDDRDPPVVIVGTWKDALISNVEKIDHACRKSILKYTENMSEDELGHIRQEYFISNTEDDPSVFQQIRENILHLARKMKTWNKDYPLKFIQLETRLQEKKKELPIISFQEIQHISTDTPNPLNDEELRLFLEFHHEIRALVYFKDLPSYIILDTKWLSDAFRYIVTAKKFRAISIKNRKKWDELYSRGKLHSEVLEDIFQKRDNMFSKHKDHILNVMERFDIIIRPNMSESAEEKPCYYVPCLIKKELHCDIYETFNVTDYTCKKSTWLCFKFRFKPPHLMNHLIASLSRKYEIAEVVVPNQIKKSVALFGGIAVFELQKKTHLRKLLVMTFPNFIQVQVLEFRKYSFIKRGLYKDIGDFVTEELEKIIHTRFKMSNVEFEKKFECGHTKPELVTGSNEFSEEQITEYLCGTCKTPHTFDGEWSEIDSKAPSDKYEKKPGQRGLALIVNFMFHGEKSERKGSDVDCKNLTHFFKEELKYQVECTTRDMTKLELMKYFQEIARTYLTEKSKDYHSFICVIMSHGNEDGIITTNGLITVEEIKKPFKNKSGGKFNGKPKLFLIQACRGGEKQEKVVVSDCFGTKIHTGHVGRCDEFPGNRQRRSSVETSVIKPGILDQPSASSEVFYTDAHSFSSKNVPTDADIIVAYASTPGYVSIRNEYKGAFFIRAFLSVAKSKYNEEHIEEILRNVRNELATNPEYAPQYGKLAGKCQMGQVETTSTKKFFL
ncbi:uncharacterized protein [Mytilus edulis]|uniref:uncharacterized protein isoform X2 n=1 Tax=Mytilus edulis TaxID=6550 RepID=UPI0039EE96B0